MKNLYKIILLTICAIFFSVALVHAQEEVQRSEEEITTRLNSLELSIQNYTLNYPEYIYIESPLIIDVNRVGELIGENFPEAELRYEWNIEDSEYLGPSVSHIFSRHGKHTLSLQIIGKIEEQEKIVYEKKGEVFIFEQSIPILASIKNKDTLEDFINEAKIEGIYIYTLSLNDEKNINSQDIYISYEEYLTRFSKSSDYLVVWGEKEFLFTFLRKLGNENNQKINNIVLMSGYNKTIFNNYIKNSLGEIPGFSNAFLLDDIVRNQILRNPNSYEFLKNNLENNGYDILKLSTQNQNNPWLFISSGVQKLGKFMTQSELYFLLLLPLFLTCVSIMKHIIGINCLGIIVPVFLAYIYMSMGFLEGVILFLMLFIINITVSQFITKYPLLYMPKVSFLITINIVIFFLLFHISDYIPSYEFSFDNILPFMFFLVVMERTIVIITSKEIIEYRHAIVGTFLMSILLFGIYHIDALKIFFLSTPEIILLLIPINFFLAKFTGLRITEYIRFKEVIKDIEE